MVALIAIAVVLLAWSNGANDNFKGVATIYGSRTASYRAALLWATAMQLAGSLLALALAGALAKTFSASGLVPPEVAASPAFLGAAALGAALTVLLATATGMPISTTHALTGALAGAGFVLAGARLNLGVLGKAFFLPLAVSPLLAAVVVTVLYPLVRSLTRLNVPHFASAGAVCFARALNDTPKIVALALAARALPPWLAPAVVGAAMAAGGVIQGRRVAETMARKITPLDARQGFVANVTTAALVLGASHLGLPVSTTHVANGGLFAVGLVSRTARVRTIIAILLAWVTTLPIAAALGALGALVWR
jgi:inorganic phosphate transporter, PiT family